MYIPNPQKWVQYYQKVASGSVNPYTDVMLKTNQIGGSVNSTAGFMIPIGSQTKTTPPSSSDVKLQLISPAQQVVEQAKEEIKKPIKKRKISKKIILPKRRRRSNTSKRPIKKSRNPRIKHSKSSKRKTTKTQQTKGKKRPTHRIKQKKSRSTLTKKSHYSDILS